ncbi:hypothetical protein HGRIS_006173 [Hohenbuehelia grisea]|uniref:Phosphoglycerate mutase n=1 Tax=Hohenbuehelia grisea TaxID=104357 RepID=A0ABR3JZ14_9AGAR
MPATFLFIRHGESTDNVKSVWAGWKDAPLSNHGMNQARALGQVLASTPLKAIHSSDLKRAFMTAESVQACQQATQPLIIPSALLREQHFGVAEGKSYRTQRHLGMSLDDHFAQEMYPTIHSRTEKFPEGESTNDLALRAVEAIKGIVLPYVWDAAQDGSADSIVAITSHGLFIKEAIAALIGMDSSGRSSAPGVFKGLANTGWVRVVIDVVDVRAKASFIAIPR